MTTSLVLLIDDDNISNVFSSILIKKKCPQLEILILHSAIEAIKYLKDENNEKPMLIFLDLNMPVMNGWEFIEEFKKINLKIDIVLLTSSSNLEDVIRSQEYNEIKQYLIKPITAENLKKVLPDVS